MLNFPARYQHYLLLALLLIAATFFAACSESHRSPTDPELAPMSTTATASAAKAASPAGATGAASGQIIADKNGNGHGGHGGGGGHGKPGGDLTLAIQPDVWNTNWSHSSGTVSALIEGSDLDKIDLSSIVLIGKTGGTPVPAQRAQLTGNHVRAFFLQSAAIASLDHPKSGDVDQVTVQFTIAGASKSLTDQVRIVGPGSGGGGGEVHLTLQIQPDSWNTNWAHSSGTVTALIRGDGLSKVDLKSIVLIGTDAAAAPLPAQRATLTGNHVRAWFPMSGALKTLDTPTPGERHKITIELMADGTKTDLTAEIRVVGPGH
jgi:hypothetical protein